MAFLNAADVALYFLEKQSIAPVGERIDNIKLQKLCYYAQGFSLAKLKTPLFFDRIERRGSGPVIPVLWRSYTRYGHGSIPMPEQPLNLEIFSPDAKGVLNEVYETFDSLEGSALGRSTGVGPPWSSIPTGAPITHQKMQSFFQKMLGTLETSSEDVPESESGFRRNARVEAPSLGD